MTAEEPAAGGVMQTGTASGFTETLLSALETALALS
jgi:hypothetical protein